MNKTISILILVNCVCIRSLSFFFLFQSHNEEDLSEGEGDSAREHDDADSCDEIRRHNNLLAEHGDVLAKLKMQVRDIKVGVSKRRYVTFRRNYKL